MYPTHSWFSYSLSACCSSLTVFLSPGKKVTDGCYANNHQKQGGWYGTGIQYWQLQRLVLYLDLPPDYWVWGRFYYCSGSEAFNPFIHGIGYCHFFMCYFTDRRDCCSGGQAEWYARVRYNCRGIPRRCMYRFTGRPVGGQRLPGNSVSHIFGGLLVIVALSMLISTMR